MYIDRKIEDTVRKISETFPVLILTGPRQVGKTTLLTKLAGSERRIDSLDDPTVRYLAKNDPKMFLERYAPPVLIDEVQYAPELFDYIKIAADRDKRCGDFWLTGSQTFRMMKNVSESLAGRAGVIRLLGLSNSEIRGNDFGPFSVDMKELIRRKESTEPMTLQDVYERIFKGSMPRLYEDPEVDRAQYYESYLETYISRDVRELSQVGNINAFLTFVRAAAARTATNVNYTEMAAEAGISVPTARQWLSILVSSGLVILIQPYFNNALKRVVKTPRMYFADTGLAAYLTGWSSPEILESGAMNGAYFETWVVTEIYKSYINAGLTPPLYFYRDLSRREIDLIIFRDGIVNPIEIKKSSAPKDAVKNFSVLDPVEAASRDSDIAPGLKAKVGTGAVVCMAGDVFPIDRKNWYVPAWLI
ncbi:MAG: ATP-binding protein [Eubacterium sp.]|jgi:predicted AAA+ superfamily ATPase